MSTGLRAGTDGVSEPLPAFVDTGAEQTVIRDHLRRAVVDVDRRPERASAEVWTVLLRLAERLAEADAAVPPFVAEAMTWIEARLAEPLRVTDVAAAVGVSSSHLVRQFQRHVGVTVVAFIRRRRVERAQTLLEQTTMPIGTIAGSCGFADLQTLNKACRAEIGVSPRAIRHRP